MLIKERLSIYIIFILSLVLSEQMWNISVELREIHYGRKIETMTMIGGSVILGIGEIVIINSFLGYANQQIGVEETLLEYAMMIFLAGVQLLATVEAMKKYKTIGDKLVIMGISMFCLLIGGISKLI